jgi:valyl-tRNA synthetase
VKTQKQLEKEAKKKEKDAKFKEKQEKLASTVKPVKKEEEEKKVAKDCVYYTIETPVGEKKGSILHSLIIL